MSGVSPCLSCGACCAYFRVSFYWGEAKSAGGCVPDILTEKVNHHLSCMQGTNAKSPRCAALMGDIGSQVRCTIYENRPSPCREFTSNAEPAPYNPGCDAARAHYGLPPLSPVQDEAPAA